MKETEIERLFRQYYNRMIRLADVGYKWVNLKGGIIGWQEANMPVVKE